MPSDRARAQSGERSRDGADVTMRWDLGARVHRKLSRQGAGLNLLLSARTGTIMLSARAQALLVSYATVGRDDGLDGGCSLSSSRNRFLLRSEKRLNEKRGLERNSGPYEFPLPADVPEECKFMS